MDVARQALLRALEVVETSLYHASLVFPPRAPALWRELQTVRGSAVALKVIDALPDGVRSLFLDALNLGLSDFEARGAEEHIQALAEGPGAILEEARAALEQLPASDPEHVAPKTSRSVPEGYVFVGALGPLKASHDRLKSLSDRQARDWIKNGMVDGVKRAEIGNGYYVEHRLARLLKLEE